MLHYIIYMFKKENQKIIKIVFGIVAVLIIASMLISSLAMLFN